MSVSNPAVLLPPRSVEISRQTAETKIRGSLCLDGSGEAVVQTGLGFLDHMLCSLTKHAGCLLYTSPSPRDRQKSRMPSSA